MSTLSHQHNHQCTECGQWGGGGSKWIGSWAGAFFFSRVCPLIMWWCPVHWNFRNFWFLGTGRVSGQQKNWKFRNFDFFGLKGWVASPKIENFEIWGFLVNSPRSGHQKIEIFNFLVLGAALSGPGALRAPGASFTSHPFKFENKLRTFHPQDF